ncbi:MAG: hypothetical protein H0U74_15700 [Bradymonadaceae bacterium]|nr:hypothetical protein [Lujinxingiaceae bacterium]
MNRTRLTVLSAFLMLSLYSFSASANECAQDSDCPADYVCNLAPTPCAVAPCADGEECPDIVCDDKLSGYCQAPPPAACESTADCGDGLVCVTSTYHSCSGSGGTEPACREDGKDCSDFGSDPDPGDGDYSCEVVTESYCVPPYYAPCEVDSDCGPGFDCNVVPMGCADSGGSMCDFDPNSDDQSCDDTPAPDYECPEADESVRYCQLKDLPCTETSECTDGFVCETYSRPSGSMCAYDPDSDTTDCDDTPDPGNGQVEGQCTPPGYYYDSRPGAHDNERDYHTSAPADGDDNGAKEFFDGAPSAGGERDGGSGGCQVAPLGQGAPSALLLALGAIVLGLSRRRRA